MSALTRREAGGGNSGLHAARLDRAGELAMELKKLVGRRVVVLGPKLLDQEKLETVVLLGVDEAGIWIESEAAADRVADRFRLKPAGRSAFFIPFAQITTIIASNEEPATASEAAAA